jgi:hypothetical protein
VVTKAQLPELLSELNVTLASPDVMLEAVGISLVGNGGMG